jgi:nicotinamidase-related amidase
MPGPTRIGGVEAGNLRTRKTTPDAYHRTELQALLEQQAVSNGVICGMHTDFCVDTTTRRALALGYTVMLVEDAPTTRDKAHLSAAHIIGHHDETLANLSSFGPRVRSVFAEGLRIAK